MNSRHDAEECCNTTQQCLRVVCNYSNPPERQGMPSLHDSMQAHPAAPGCMEANTVRSQSKPLQCCETRVMHGRGKCQAIHITSEGGLVSTPPNTIMRVTALKRFSMVVTEVLCWGIAPYDHPQVDMGE